MQRVPDKTIPRGSTVTIKDYQTVRRRGPYTVNGELIIDGTFVVSESIEINGKVTINGELKRRPLLAYTPDVSTTTLENTLERQPALDGNNEEVRAAIGFLSSAVDDLVVDANDIAEAELIEYATEGHLDKLGDAVDVQRPTGEDDDTYRRRVKAAYTAAFSDGTYEDVAKTAVRLLNVSPKSISVRRADESNDPATAVIEIDNTALDETSFDINEIVSILGRAKVGGHRIIIEEQDVFTFDNSENGWGTDWGARIRS